MSALQALKARRATALQQQGADSGPVDSPQQAARQPQPQQHPQQLQAAGGSSTDRAGCVQASSSASQRQQQQQQEQQQQQQQQQLGVRQGDPSAAGPATKLVQGLSWLCGTCNAECIPIRTESRCLCGHRFKEHAKLTPGATSAKCCAARCPCSNFFYIVAEGSWVLRCSCKHKHTEHDPAGAAHACVKPGCKCGAFHSPWVCNCDHPWGDHRQVVVEREMLTLAGMMAAASVEELCSGAAPDVNRFDLIKRGGE